MMTHSARQLDFVVFFSFTPTAESSFDTNEREPDGDVLLFEEASEAVRRLIVADFALGRPR